MSKENNKTISPTMINQRKVPPTRWRYMICSWSNLHQKSQSRMPRREEAAWRCRSPSPSRCAKVPAENPTMKSHTIWGVTRTIDILARILKRKDITITFLSSNTSILPNNPCIQRSAGFFQIIHGSKEAKGYLHHSLLMWKDLYWRNKVIFENPT